MPRDVHELGGYSHTLGQEDPWSCGFHGQVVMKCCTYHHELEDGD